MYSPTPDEFLKFTEAQIKTPEQIYGKKK